MAIIKFTHNNKTYTCLLFKGSVALNMRQVCTNVEVTDGKELDYINLKVDLKELAKFEEYMRKKKPAKIEHYLGNILIENGSVEYKYRYSKYEKEKYKPETNGFMATGTLVKLPWAKLAEKLKDAKDGDEFDL